MMSAKTRAAFIFALMVFIISALVKVAIELLEIYTLTEEKLRLIVMLTSFFIFAVTVTITMILKKFGRSPREIKNLHKFIMRAIEVEAEMRSKNSKRLTTIESREFDLGYYLLSAIGLLTVLYGLSILLIIERGERFFEFLIGGVLEGVVRAILAANLLLPLIHYAAKGAFSDEAKGYFGIPAKIWIVAGALILLAYVFTYNEFYAVVGVSTFFMGFISHMYLKKKKFYLIALYLALLSLPYVWLVRQVFGM